MWETTYPDLSENSECSHLQDISFVNRTLRVKLVDCEPPYIRLACVHQTYTTSWAHGGQLDRLTTNCYLVLTSHLLQGTGAAFSVAIPHSVQCC